jgi:hypothetical protein
VLGEGPEWRFEGRAVLGTYEPVRLPAWLGGAVVSMGPARSRARRAVARTYAAIEGEEGGDRGLVGAFRTDPRREATAEPFSEETDAGVRCGYDLEFAVTVDPDTGLATWPNPRSDAATVRTGLVEAVRTRLTEAAGETPDSVRVERADPFRS